jgi:hypothetical protein
MPTIPPSTAKPALLSDEAPVAVGQDAAPVTGSSTTGMLRWVIAGLVAVAVALMALTAGYWRHTRPGRPAPRPADDGSGRRPGDSGGAGRTGGGGGGAAVSAGTGGVPAGRVPGRPDGGPGPGGVPTVVVRGAGADAGAGGFRPSPATPQPAP